VEGSSHAKNQLDSFSRFSRTPTCDRQTDRQTQAHGYYRGCLASRGKNRFFRARQYLKDTVIHINKKHLVTGPHFYRAMLCIRGTSHGPVSVSLSVRSRSSTTRSSAIAEGPRDASCKLKSCQLPHNSAETTYTTSPDQIDGMKLEI